ncbi:hypothetical protein [uncultured Croceitalea sp.]|uniref:hypothetical protein n=1 Tax=uncultured Croceitalea sp. TaxID=1798908 RepID=UPI003305DADD
MLKKSLTYLFLVTLLVLNSSCFDILEEINLKKDGSGTMLITVNMSKSKTKLASIMLLDSINGYKVPSEDDIELALNDVMAHLKKSKGITNIKQTKDFENYIFSVSCDFESIESLNGITAHLIQEQNKRESTKFETSNFAYNATEKVFERKFTYDASIKKSFDYLKKEDKKVFQDASFTAIYRFEDQIEETSNTIAKIAPSKKAVMLRVDAMSFILGEKTIKNKVKLINSK